MGPRRWLEDGRRRRRRAGVRGDTFTDPDASVIRRYDVAHEGAGPHGELIARPAEFLVDVSGTIRWANLTGSIMVRARPEQVLRAVDEPGLGRPAPR